MRRYKGFSHCVGKILLRPHSERMILLIFDFDRFTISVTLAYRRCGGSSCTLPEVLRVFRYYFETYELIFNEAHPAISIQQIANIIDKMPVISDSEYEDEEGRRHSIDVDLTPEDYKLIIDQHFNTKYQLGCDYNINHFFSGKIRENRYYETSY